MKLKKLKLPHFAGKLVGLILGFLLAGWPGAALGIILGHSFDYHQNAIFTRLLKLGRRFCKILLPKSSEQLYRDTLFICLGHVAKHNGRISPQEIAAAEALFKRMKLNTQQRTLAIEHFNKGKLASIQIEKKLAVLHKRYATKKVRRLEFIDHLLNMAYAGGPASESQIKLLYSFLPLLNLSSVDFERLHRRIREQKGYRTQQNHQRTKAISEPTLLTAYRALGVSSDASPEEIKLGYRKLMSLHHPDKLMAQGLTDQALEKGKERAQEIQQAYSLLKKTRGF